MKEKNGLLKIEWSRHKKHIGAFFAVFCVLIAAAILVILTRTVQAESGPPDSSPSDTWDLYNFVTGVVIRDSGGQIITTGPYYYGNTYNFTVSFAERLGANGQFSYNTSGKMVYQLPSNLVVTAADTGPIHLSNGAAVGHYAVSTNGRVEVWFDQVDNNGEGIDFNFIDYYSDINFNFTIKAKFDEGSTQGEIWFGVGAEITIDFDYAPSALKLEKTAGSYNPSAESVSFEIKITATGNKVTNLKLTDVLSFNLENYGIKEQDVGDFYQNPFKQGTGSFEYRIGDSGNWTVINTPNWTPDGSGLLFNFGTLQRDETITLRYTLQLGGILDYFTDEGWIERLRFLTIRLSNSATATGKDGDKELTATGITQTPLSKKFLNKSGARINDGSDIRWTAGAGDGSVLLNNQVITDTLGPNQSAPAAGDVTVKVYGAPSAYGVFSNPYTLAPGEVLPCLSITGNVLTFTVPAGGFPGGAPSVPNVYRVELIYVTVPDNPEPGSVYTNNISVNINGNTSSENATVGFPLPSIGNTLAEQITGEKHSEWLYDENGELRAIKYTLVVNTPAGLKSSREDCYIYDYLIHDLSTTISLSELENYANTFQVKMEPDDGPVVIKLQNNSTILLGDGISPSYAALSNSNCRWPWDDARTFTITYEVPMDFPLVKDRFVDKSGTLRNEGFQMYVGSVISEPLGRTYDYYPIAKYSVGEQDEYDFPKKTNFSTGVFNYSVVINSDSYENTFDYNDITFDYMPVFAPDQPAIFMDNFDPRLEYVEGSFFVFATRTYYGPYNRNGNEWEDLVTHGDGYLSVDFSDPSFVEFPGYVNYTKKTWQEAFERTNTELPVPDNWYAGKGKIFEVHYQLRIKDEYAQTYPDQKMEFTNKATIYCTGEKANHPFSKSCTVEYYEPAVTKGMNITGTTAAVDIIINPDGKRLRPLGIDEQKFTAVDKMNGDLAFYLNTIEFSTKTKQPDGSWGGWEPVEPAEFPELWSINNIDAQTVEFLLPDEKPIRITYTALITAPVGTTASFTNNISVCGYSSFYESGSFTVQDTGANAFGKKKEIRLYKEDALTGRRLTGGIFDLYLRIDGDGSYDGGTHDTITVGNYTFHKLTSSAQRDGAYVFADNHITPTYDELFLLVERRAPGGGYDLPDPEDPDSYMYFTIKPFQTAALNAFQTAIGGRTVQLVPDNIYLTNTRQVAKQDVVIYGEKNVIGAGAPAGTFSFSLTQVADKAGNPYRPDEEAIRRTTSRVTSGEGNYPFQFAPIKELPVGTYYFTVEESHGGDAAGWYFDSARKLITVVVDPEGEVEVSYPEGGLFVPFNNIYGSPRGSLIIRKIALHGLNGEAFTFTVLDGNGTPVALAGDGISVSKIGGFGTYAATDLPNGVFSLTNDTKVKIDGLKPGEYTVKETDSGYTTTYTVDGGGVKSGTEADVDVSEDTETVLEFTNAGVEPTTQVIIKGRKVVDGTNVPEEIFSFSLQQVKNEQGDPMFPAPNPLTVQREGSGPFEFPPITELTASGSPYFFVIEEVDNEIAGWSFDKTRYLVTVTVEGNPPVANVITSELKRMPPRN